MVNPFSTRPSWLSPTFAWVNGLAEAMFKASNGEGRIWFDNGFVRVVVTNSHGRHVFRLNRAQAIVLSDLLIDAALSIRRAHRDAGLEAYRDDAA